MVDVRTLLHNLDQLPQFAGMLLQIGLGLLVLFDVVRERTVAIRHSGYLLLFALLSVSLYGATYLTFPVGLVEAIPALYVYGGALVAPVLCIVYGAAGVASCERLGIEAMPLLRAALEGAPIPECMFKRRFFIESALVAIAAPGYALLIGGAFATKLATPLCASDGVFVTMGMHPAVPKIPLVAAGALGSAIVVRLGLQNWLAVKLGGGKRLYWVAIAIAAVVGAGVPFSTQKEDMVAFAVRYPVHVGLGLLFKRYGLATSLLAHGGFLTLYHAFA
jgi:hypothetical protein